MNTEQGGTEAMGMADSKPDCLVLLIHGTYAANAKWPTEGSNFRAWLKQSLIDCGAGQVRFEAFSWSGGNSDLDRVAASESLRTKLADLRAKYPEFACFLVGHSHGGNVALHALSHSDQDRFWIAGVVTLATPFLIFDEEPTVLPRVATALLEMRIFALMFLGPAILALIFIPFLVWIIPWFIDLKIRMLQWSSTIPLWLCEQIGTAASCQWSYDGIYTVAGVGLGGLMLVGMIVAIWAEVHKAATSIEASTRAAVERFYYVQPAERLSKVPILVLSSVIDEALQILNFSWWIHRAALWATRVWILLMAATGIVTVLAGLWWVYANYTTEIAQAIPSSSAILRNTMMAYAALPVGFAAAAAVGWAFRAFVRLPVPLHGSQASLDNLLWTLRAQRVPFDGDHMQRRSYNPWQLFREAPGLIHSTLHGSRAASKDIAKWMVETARS